MPAAAAQPAEEETLDCIIVGGGPSGLSAALILGRARRRVAIFDSGEKRNEASIIQHAILGADGFHRQEFLDQAREQVLLYPTVSFFDLAVTDINIEAARTEACSPGEIEAGTCHTKLKSGERITKTGGFEVTTEDGRVWQAKKCVLATGVRDLIPQQLAPFWGKGVWVCLYCDAYEYSRQPFGAYGNGERGVHIAFEMLLWSRDVMLFTDGEELEATAKEREVLKRHVIRVETAAIKECYGAEDGELAGLVLDDGRRVPVQALFFNTGRCQNSELPGKMGLKSDDRGDIICELKGNVESVHGLYVAGNCATAPLKLVMTAASQGATVGAKINSELMYEELGLADGLEYTDEERDAIREQQREESAAAGAGGGDGEVGNGGIQDEAEHEAAGNGVVEPRGGAGKREVASQG